MTAAELASKSPEELVDSALQVYARTGLYPNSRELHDAAMAYRIELIRIVTDYRDLIEGRQAVIPKTAEHARHLLTVAQACLK